jgi:hypothetical protein
LNQQPDCDQVQWKLDEMEFGCEVGSTGSLDESEWDLGDAICQNTERNPLENVRTASGKIGSEP